MAVVQSDRMRTGTFADGSRVVGGEGATRRRASLSGWIVNADLEYPVVDVGVAVSYVDVDGDGERDGHHDRFLGSATSDRHGRFRIVADREVHRNSSWLLLRDDPEAEIVFRVGSPDKPYVIPQAARHGLGSPVRLRVPLPAAEPDEATWAELARRAKEHGILQLHDLARELALTPAAQSIFSDWPLDVRHAIVGALERALLDPDGLLTHHAPAPTFAALHAPDGLSPYARARRAEPRNAELASAYVALRGKAVAFRNVFEADWVVDLDKLAVGQPGPATKAYSDAYQWASTDEPAMHAAQAEHAALAPLVEDANLISYRNYLRSIFTGPSGSSDYGARRDELERRFHQSFAVVDCTQRPANRILLPIVKAILQAQPGDGYGFGVAAIPPQGTKSDRDYLDQLIALSGLDAKELGLRFRLDLTRPDTVLSNPVQENITTLQHFYADGIERAPTVPDPVPITWHQVAPFFLEYEEWLSGRHFFPENAYVLRPTFTVPSSYGKALQDQIDLQVGEPAMWPETVWFKHVQAMAKHLEDAYASFDLGEYPAARTSFEQARSAAQNALVETPFSPKDATDLYHLGDSLAAWLHPLLQDLMALDLTDLDGVAALTEFFAFRDPDPDYPSPNADQGEKGGSGFDFRDQLQAWALSLLHLYLYVLPAYLAETAVRMGDFPGAMAEFARTTGFLVARAEPTDAAGDLRADDEMVRAEGRLPYTADLRAEDESAAFKVAAYYLGEDGLARRLIPNWTHPVERRLLRLRYGAAILEWADSLYRADDEAATARARELYKAVLYLHGDPPPLDPNWSGNELAEIIALTGGAVTVKPHTENPDLTSQKARATAELLKIEAGLNFYGADDRLVPSQRFRVLKSAADRFAASAKAAQQDFLLATSNIEASIRERIVATNMLRKAKIQAQIADEQRAIAEFAVAQAQRQVDQINAAIEAKKAEIADHDSFGTAFVDWATGFKKNLDALPKEATSNLSSAYSSGAFSMSGDAGSGGAAAAEGGSSASASLGVAGAWIAVGYAAAQSLVSWSDAQDQREKELHALEYDALPWAQQQVAATQHGVAIAQLQRQLAEADADLASDLLRFESERLLNAEFWAAVVGVMQRVMRRYLDLGGRFAWLAERALAYEQDRNISLVRFNYFPAKLGGVTGADLLELDLAELEAAWADGLRETLPITRTYSLALDFPAAFAQLRKTGSCGFLTTEAPYRISHPGTYRHRIRAVTVAVQSLAPIGRMRGLLTNRGVSTLSRSDGTTHSSVRYPDALPLTEFDLRRDLAAFGDGDGTMRSFEGSGVETFWELELPAAANPYGMDQIADVLITIDAAASWSPSLHELDESSAPTTAHRSVIISAGAQSPDAADQLENAAALSLPFDLTKALLPSSESIRTITNLALFLVGSDASTTASFGTANAPGTEFAFDKGIAASNAPPLSDGSSPTPLSTFVAQPVEQVFELVMSNQDGLRDVVLLIEYEATLAT